MRVRLLSAKLSVTMIVAVASAQRKKERLAKPLDPAALAVASVLKSLRTRIGLQEERLHGTELALDTLTGLDSVKALVNVGESSERAIVRAVRAAASTLEPTMSIVADASLGLRLAVDQVPDADLYAQDLGQRREALLRNWVRLHELRSVPAGIAPSPRALRLEVESEALSALAVALTTGASAGEPTKGPTGANEPQTSEARSGAATADPAAPTLLETFQNVARALRERLTRDAYDIPSGWQHDLREPPGEATAVSTAYGLRAMLLLEDGLAADLIPVAQSLRKMVLPGGGYASRGQTGPRAESTAVVLNALRRIAATDDFGAYIGRMESDLGDFEKSRPFILTTMLETSLLLGPKSRLVKVLVDSLLAARRKYDDLQLWPEKSEDEPIRTHPSVAHTARAVRVLADVQATRPDSQVQEALDQAVAWLIGQRDLHNTYEFIERRLHDGTESVHTWHFTAAWVVKALVSAGIPATCPSVSNAVTRIWSSYTAADHPDRVGASLWQRDNSDLPIWMTFDAIEALRLANLAVPAPPRLVTPP